MDYDEINAIARLVLIIAFAMTAYLLAIRAWDIARDQEAALRRDLRLTVATGWALATLGVALQRSWWWLSWAVQVQDGSPAFFRAYAHWALLPDILTLIGLTLAVTPYASRIWPTRWYWLAISGLPAIILGSTIAVLWIAA